MVLKYFYFLLFHISAFFTGLCTHSVNVKGTQCTHSVNVKGTQCTHNTTLK